MSKDKKTATPAPLELPAAGDTTPSAREQADMGTLVPLAEAATRLGWSTKTAYRKARAGQLPGAHKVPGATGEQWVVPVVLVEQLQATATAKATLDNPDKVQATELHAKVQRLELALAIATAEAKERAQALDNMQGAMRALTAASNQFTVINQAQAQELAAAKTALAALLARKWWQRKNII